MPMPPVINPYDPRKNQQKPAQQAGQQPAQAQPAAPVQSSLPSMQQPQQAPTQQQVAQAGQPQQATQAQQKKPAAPVTYQQQAGAVADPRFSQALAQKLQQDVAAKQAALQQQQAQFQEKLTQAAGGVPAQQRIGDLLGKITSGTASEAELGEYEKLQKLQYQGPTGLEGTANIAALSQLAGSPELLAQQYAGFAPGGVRPGDFAKAMAGLQKSPELASAQQAATGLAEKAMSAEEIAAQQAGLLKGQTEAAKTQAETAVKAEQEKYMAGLGEEAKGEVEAKKSALDKLKAGLFMGQKVSQADLQKLGLSKEDLQNLKGLDVSKIEGLSEIKSVEDLNKEVEKLKTKATEQGSESLTPEQQRLVNMYGEMSGLSRESDEGAGLAYAKKQDLAKINALRRLTGQAPIKEEDIGKGFESGKIGKESLSGMIGRLREQQGKYVGQEEVEAGLAKQEERLTGDKWYKGGLNKALSDVKKAKIPQQFHQIARDMITNMKTTGATQNNLYKWIQKNYDSLNPSSDKYDAKKAKEFKKKIEKNIGSYTEGVSGKKGQLEQMSDISKGLEIE